VSDDLVFARWNIIELERAAFIGQHGFLQLGDCHDRVARRRSGRLNPDDSVNPAGHG